MNASNKSIINLSDKTLTLAEQSLLNKGLKFCPTPGNPDIGELWDDMSKLHKRLRQIAFFEDPEDCISDHLVTPDPPMQDTDNLSSKSPFKHQKFKLPSKGRGPPGPNNLEAMITVNEQQFNSRPAFQRHTLITYQSKKGKP